MTVSRKRRKEKRVEEPSSTPLIFEWKKELFHRQPFPDNYSGGEEKFLNELKKNVSAVKYSLPSAFIGSAHFMGHLNAVVLYFVLFEGVHNGDIDELTLTSSFTILTLLCYLFYVYVLSSDKWETIRQLVILSTLLTFGYALSPIIRTLTTTISTDTIYALSFIFSLVSCTFHDYGIKAPIVSQPLSVSSGLSSAIFLLSRLSSSLAAFSLLAVAFSLHAYWPILHNSLFERFPLVSTVISLMLGGLSICLLFPLNPFLSFLWCLFTLFTLFLCPLLLVSLQTRKSTIHGPWDEAVPQRSASSSFNR